MKSVLLVLGGFVVGGVAAGAVVYFAARRTQRDLTGAGADMQAAFEAAGRLTASQLQSQADAFAANIARVGAAKIQAAAASTALQVTQEFGITPSFIADVQQLQQVYATARTNPFAAAASYIARIT